VVVDLGKWRKGARLCFAKSWSVSEVTGGPFAPETYQHARHRASVVWKADGTAPWVARVPVGRWIPAIRVVDGAVTTESNEVFEVRNRRWVVLTAADLRQAQGTTRDSWDTATRRVAGAGSAALAGLLLVPPRDDGRGTRLSPTELASVYKAAGLTERNGKFLNDCEDAVDPQVDTVDLNGDGVPEVFVLVGNSLCYGMAGAKLSLLIKDEWGRWQSNLGFSAGGYKLLGTKNKGYPDIEIGGPGMCVPTWRWNGSAYAIHKSCD
jgi:hypothetical protein